LTGFADICGGRSAIGAVESTVAMTRELIDETGQLASFLPLFLIAGIPA
jgi:hypothetical protein